MYNRSFRRWQLKTLILCWCAYACIYLGRVNLSVAIPGIQEALGAGKLQVGLIGSLFFWVYGVGQLVNSSIGERVSGRLFIFIGLLLTGLVNLLFGFAASILLMCVLWAANGCFQSMLWGPMVKTITRWVEPEKRGPAVIWVSTSMVGGFLLSWGVSGQLLVHMGWRWLFWIPGVVIAVCSLAWVAFVRNRPEDAGLALPGAQAAHPHSGGDSQAVENVSLWGAIRRTRLWLVVAACLAQGIIKDGISIWAPTFFIETYRLDILSTVSLIVAIPVMNFLGMLLAGRLHKKLGNEKRATMVLFLFGVLSIAGLYLFGRLGMLLGLALLGLSSAMMYGANTLLLGIVPLNFVKYNKVSTIAGFLDFCSYMASGAASAITGLLCAIYDWGGVMVFWLVIAVLGAAALYVGSRGELGAGKRKELRT